MKTAAELSSDQYYLPRAVPEALCLGGASTATVGGVSPTPDTPWPPAPSATVNGARAVPGADPREMCMLRVRYGWDVCYGYVTGWSEGGIERRCQTLGDGPHWNRGWDRAASLDAGRGASIADLGVEELRPRRRTLPRTRLSADRCADTGWSCQPRGAGKEKGV